MDFSILIVLGLNEHNWEWLNLHQRFNSEKSQKYGSNIGNINLDINYGSVGKYSNVPIDS